MWSFPNRAMEYSDRGKFRRRDGVRKRLKSISFIFPLLSICSLLMNGSMHFRRTASVMNVIERGPPATRVPDDLPRGGTNKALTSHYRRAKADETSNAAGTGTGTVKQKGQAGGVLDNKTIRKQAPANPTTRYSNQIQKGKKMGVKTVSVKAKKKTVTHHMKKTEGKPRVDTTKLKTETKSKAVVDPITQSRGSQDNQVDEPPTPSSVSRQALASNATLAACLLVRDDNDIMPEWLAYHYHTLRMRRLIVAVDPHSETSPSDVLDGWKEYLDIDVWTDDMYMPQVFLRTGIPPDEYVENITKFGDINYEQNIAINAHRYRQKFFLGKCFQQFKQEDRSLVLHIDTDEYVVPNKLLREAKEVEIQPVSKPGAILDLLQTLLTSDPALVGYPCISMLRLLFGSVEKEEDEWAQMPAGYDRRSFETLRWRYHGSARNKKMHGHPKVLVDISKIPKQFLSKKVLYSIHRPFAKFCRGQGESDYSNFQKYPITANHYLGSWERYNKKNDTRRSLDVYNERATLSGGEDGWLDGWLDGFIEDVGEDTVAHLLGQRYKANAVATA